MSDRREAYRLDDIDRRVIYALMAEARRTSAPEIAAEVSVSPATIRNRIDALEEHRIIDGYHAHVNFERVDGRLTNLFLCTVPTDKRDSITGQVCDVPGVVNVRELMGGRLNLHVLAVGESLSDLRRIDRELADLGIEVEDEVLVENEHFEPYAPFAPDADRRRRTLDDFISLAGGAEVVEVTVRTDAPIADTSLEEANRRGLLGDETLVIAIERDERVLTPRGGTTIRPDDTVTVFSRGGVDEDAVDVFLGDEE